MNKYSTRPSWQPHNKWIAAALALAIVLSACSNPAPTPSTEAILFQAQTAAMETHYAQAVDAFTATPAPTATPTTTPTCLPTASPTAFFTPAHALSSSNSQGLYESASTTYKKEDAEFIRDMNVPDGTVVPPGDIFIKTWKFKNTGDHAWTPDYSIIFISGDIMDGANTRIGETVRVNKKIEISVELTAPYTEGIYTGYWQMADEYGNPFGPIVYVQIIVSEYAESGAGIRTTGGAYPACRQAQAELPAKKSGLS